jgi:glycosyltransferase involved in cell wall biosynthesis
VTKLPLVSIVLPTYKRAHVLPGAIMSVLAQTYRNLELIIVDDNSPDNTPDVVAGFSDPRIRYVRNDPNLRLPRALNRGFALARGDLLTWTSDDNFYAATAIERMVSAIEQRGLDFVYADYYLFADLDATGKPTEVRHDRLPDQLQLARGNHIGACFMYTRKVYETIGDYDPELFLVEDYDYFIRIAKRFRAGHIAEPLYYFRRHEDALFCSRFCEVKAADLLVRYKNDLLSEGEAVNVLVSLLARDPDHLNNALLRRAYHLVRKRSFRLAQLYRKGVGRYLRSRLSDSTTSVLARYRSGQASFAEAKQALVDLMQKLATVKYVRS